MRPHNISGFSEDGPCIAKEYNFDCHLDPIPDHPLTGPTVSVPDHPLRDEAGVLFWICSHKTHTRGCYGVTARMTSMEASVLSRTLQWSAQIEEFIAEIGSIF